jgi:hypothetical protein
MSASLYPRWRRPAATLRVSVASIQPVTPPPPSKSEEMPTWSMPATFTMWSMWSRKSDSVARGHRASMPFIPST